MAPRVLIVEDEAPLLSLYELILTNREIGGVYGVRTATTAEDALRIAAHEPPFDVVLTDYRMPGRDGISLMREIRASHPRTQFLLISGFVDASLVRQALEAGARACLRKPCSIQDLLAAVADAARAAEEAPETGAAPPAGLAFDRIGEVIEASPLHTFFVDLDYAIRQANSSFVEEYGHCEGHKCHQVLGGTMVPCAGCQAVAALDARVAKTAIRPGRSPQGVMRDIEERVEPWFDPSGLPRGLTVSFAPLTSAATQPETASPAPGLRAAAALGWVEPSQGLRMLSAAVARLLELRASESPEAAGALEGLAGELRAFAETPEAPSRPLGDLNSVVAPVLDLARETLRAAGLATIANLAAELPQAPFSRDVVEQALLDLLLAIVAARPRWKGAVRLTTFTSGGCVCLSVAIEGAPCAPGEALLGGREGLALAVVHELMASQGGTLDLAPPGGGVACGAGPAVVATIRLPLA